MKIPKFRPSNNFLGETKLPCLVAKVRNSKLPRPVATRYVKIYRKDPVCDIYLRSKDPTKISKWQHQILKRLFVKAEWVSAVRDDLKKFEADWGDDLFCSITGKEVRHFNQHGLLPFFAIQCVVIDEIKHKVLMSLDTSKVDEHGLAIYLSKDRWRLGSWDNYYDYTQSFAAEIVAKEESRWDRKLDKWHERWSKVFPSPERSEPAVSDAPMIQGTWQYDKRTTVRILKKAGLSKEEINQAIQFSPCTWKLCISQRKFEEFGFDPKPMVWRILKVERRGSTVKLFCTRQNKFKNRTTQVGMNFTYCCHDNLLALEGRNDVYRRAQ